MHLTSLASFSRANKMGRSFSKEKKKIITNSKQLLIEMGRTKCESCGRENYDVLTIDHIIPQHILRDMGFGLEEVFDMENLKVLCRMCNSMKSNHLDFTDPRTKQLLLKYLERI